LWIVSNLQWFFANSEASRYLPVLQMRKGITKAMLQGGAMARPDMTEHAFYIEILEHG
jgi:hypothetical protein